MRRALSFGLGLAALFPAALACAGASTVPVGIVAAAVGKVLKGNAADPKGKAVQLKQRIIWGDIIRTGKKSQAQLLLLDRSSVMVGANASLTINRFVFDPGKPRALSARLGKGALRFMSGRRDPGATADLDTPVGAIGIRGTVLDAVVGESAIAIAEAESAVGKGVKSDKAGATLVVLRGPGAATSGGLTVGLADVRAAGKTVTLDQPALAAYIPRPGAPPIGPFRLSGAGLSRLQDELAPAVTQANKGGGLGGLALPAAILGGVLGSGVLGGSDNPPPCVPTANRRCP